jgi:hypothetical protein
LSAKSSARSPLSHSDGEEGGRRPDEGALWADGPLTLTLSPIGMKERGPEERRSWSSLTSYECSYFDPNSYSRAWIIIWNTNELTPHSTSRITLATSTAALESDVASTANHISGQQ